MTTASSFARLVLASILVVATAGSAAARQPPAAAQASDEPDLINPDRPGIADGSRTIGGGRYQLETGLQQEFRSDAGSRTRTLFVPSLLRGGIGDRWEARVEGNTFSSERTIDQAGSSSTTSGFAPVSAGLKFTICDNKAPARFSLGTIGRLFPASGSADFQTRHTTADARLAADWDFAPRLSLNPNVGIARYESSEGAVFRAALAAVTLNFQPTNRLNPFVDIGYQGTAGNAAAAVTVDAGVAWIIGRDLQLDLSVGHGLKGDAPRPFVAAGVSVRAGREK
jgi:outer membrane putative beta-barrel porin/alpha-amylase